MIHEAETLYKLMILYMLDKVNFPLTNSQLSKFFLDSNYTTYFTLQSVLTELTESNLISSRPVGNATHYEITDDGTDALGFFASDISSALVHDMDEYLEANKFSMRSETGVVAEYFKSDRENYTVHCSVRESKSTILSIDISVPDKGAAEDMCANWKNSSQKIYSYLVNTLMRAPEPSNE